MNDRNDGGPAFPIPRKREGMSLRDYFAGQVAAELLRYFLAEGHEDVFGTAAHDAYLLADAMLKARER